MLLAFLQPRACAGSFSTWFKKTFFDTRYLIEKFLAFLYCGDVLTGGQDLIEVGHPGPADGQPDPRSQGLSVLHLGPVGNNATSSR